MTASEVTVSSGDHVIHTLVRFTVHGVAHISCAHCPLVIRQPSGMPDYRGATMSTWNRGNRP